MPDSTRRQRLLDIAACADVLEGIRQDLEETSRDRNGLN
jgi:hypothetical protein